MIIWKYSDVTIQTKAQRKKYQKDEQNINTLSNSPTWCVIGVAEGEDNGGQNNNEKHFHIG